MRSKKYRIHDNTVGKSPPLGITVPVKKRPAMLAVLASSFLLLSIAMPGYGGVDEDEVASLKVEDAKTDQTTTEVVRGLGFTFKVQMDDDVQNVSGVQFKTPMPNGLCVEQPLITEDPGNNWDVAISFFDNDTNTVSIAYAMASGQGGQLDSHSGPMDLIEVSCTIGVLEIGTQLQIPLQEVVVADPDAQVVEVATEDLIIDVGILKGDVDMDNNITDNDLNLVLEYIAGGVTLTPEQVEAADTSPAADPDLGRDECGNGTINIFDATAISNAVVSEDPISFMIARCYP